MRLIEQLVKTLGTEGVTYCHWKSNAFMDLAAQGEDDLDLLVGHFSRQTFLEILDRMGFKEASQPKGAPQSPGILDYYGYDEAASRWIHAHVHYKLILGHDMTKNYHLPVEDAYLGSCVQGPVFRVPAPEFEFVVFVVRMMIKHSTWSALLAGQGSLSSRESREMDYLQGLASREQWEHILTSHLPFLSADLFEDCLRSLQPGCPTVVRLKAGHRLLKALRGCGIRSHCLDTWLQFWRRLRGAVQNRFRRGPSRRRLKNGGMLVAFIGGDGAGKSTVVEGISKWVSACFAARAVHMGKPRWSLITIFVRGLLKVGRALGFYPFTRELEDVLADGQGNVFPGYPTLIRTVCTARDRRRSYVKARRRADNGFVVICDRFPLPGVISMDGPRLERTDRAFPHHGFVRLLARLEKRYYQTILSPDLLFVLKVNPETAVERKPDEPEASVRARSQEIWDRRWGGGAAQIIDADQPLEDVLRTIKARLWANL